MMCEMNYTMYDEWMDMPVNEVYYFEAEDQQDIDERVQRHRDAGDYNITIAVLGDSCDDPGDDLIWYDHVLLNREDLPY